MNVRRNTVAHLTALSHSRVLGQLASRLDAPRVTRALRLISTPAMPRPTLAPSISRGSAPCRIRLVPSFTSLGRQEPALKAMASIRVLRTRNLGVSGA